MVDRLMAGATADLAYRAIGADDGESDDKIVLFRRLVEKIRPGAFVSGGFPTAIAHLSLAVNDAGGRIEQFEKIDARHVQNRLNRSIIGTRANVGQLAWRGDAE